MLHDYSDTGRKIAPSGTAYCFFHGILATVACIYLFPLLRALSIDDEALWWSRRQGRGCRCAGRLCHDAFILQHDELPG